MKRIFWLILVLTLAFALVACNGSDSDKIEDDGSSSENNGGENDSGNGGDSATDDKQEYDEQYKKIYEALVGVGYTDTPEYMISVINTRAEWLGLDENISFTHEVKNGELILTLSDGSVISCGTVVYPKDTKKVTVSFSDGEYPELKIPENTKIGTLPTPEKRGYVFLYWQRGGEGLSVEESIVTENTVITEDTVLTAAWDSLGYANDTRFAELVGVSTVKGGEPGYNVNVETGKEYTFYFTFGGNVQGLEIYEEQNKLNTYAVGEYIVAEVKVTPKYHNKEETVYLAAMQKVGTESSVIPCSYTFYPTFGGDVKVVDASAFYGNCYENGKVCIDLNKYNDSSLRAVTVTLSVSGFKAQLRNADKSDLKVNHMDAIDDRIVIEFYDLSVGEYVLELDVLVETNGGERSFAIDVPVIITESEVSNEPDHYELETISAPNAQIDFKSKTVVFEEGATTFINVTYAYASKGAIESAYIYEKQAALTSFVDLTGMGQRVEFGTLPEGEYDLQLNLTNGERDTIKVVVTAKPPVSQKAPDFRWEPNDVNTGLYDRKYTGDSASVSYVRFFYNEGYVVLNVSTSSDAPIMFPSQYDYESDPSVRVYSFNTSIYMAGTYEFTVNYYRIGEENNVLTESFKIVIEKEEPLFCGMSHSASNTPEKSHVVLYASGGYYKLYFLTRVFDVKVEIFGEKYIPEKSYEADGYYVYEIYVGEIKSFDKGCVYVTYIVNEGKGATVESIEIIEVK